MPPSGVYEREPQAEPAPPSFDALGAQVRAVTEARQACRQGFIGGGPALRAALRRLAEVATALAERNAI